MQRGAGLALVGGDDHALAGRQTVGLDHRRVARDRRHSCVRIGHDRVGGGRHAGGAHHLLAERLRALEPRCRGGRAKASDPGGRERVGDPGHERRLRPDHHEVDLKPARERDYRGRILRVQRGIGHLRLARDSGVARRAQDLGPLWRASQRLDQSVLARAGAEDEDPSAQIAPMKSSIGIALSVS